MSNQEHYKLEADIKDAILRMDVQQLRNRLYDYVDEAPVSSVERLAVVLGVRHPIKV